MKRFFVTIFSFMLIGFCNAQKPKDADYLSIINSTSASYIQKKEAYEKYISALCLNNPEKAIQLIPSALSFTLKQKDSIGYAVFVRLKGLAHNSIGNRDSAVYFYYNAIDILERAKSDKELAAAYNDVARQNRKIKNLDRALFYYDKAMEIYKRIKDDEGLGTIYNESGVVFEYKENYEEALKRYNASLEIRKKMNDSVGMGYALSFIGGVYLLQKKYGLSEQYTIDALTIRKKMNDSFALALSYFDLASIYKEQKKDDLAKANFTTAFVYAKAIHYTDLQSQTLLELSNIYSNSNNFKDAFFSYKEYTQLRDSLFGIEKTKQIEELSTKYETEKKQLQIKEQEFAITKRNYWIAGIITTFLGISLLGFSYYRRYKLNKEKQLQEEVFKQQELATKAVIAAEENERKRIASDLHDGVGQMMSAAKMNLSSMEAEIPFANEEQRNVYKKVLSLVDDSCKEVRTVSHNMMPNALLKSGLATAVREFLYQIDSRVIKIDLYTEGLSEKIDTNTETVLYRVIQECVNNVIKHANANHLDISLVKDEDGIAVTIEDNGKGFDSNNKNNFNGIGLKNIQTRIQYLQGTVEWNSAIGKGTLVAIHIPC